MNWVHALELSAPVSESERFYTVMTSSKYLLKCVVLRIIIATAPIPICSKSKGHSELTKSSNWDALIQCIYIVPLGCQMRSQPARQLKRCVIQCANYLFFMFLLSNCDWSSRSLYRIIISREAQTSTLCVTRFQMQGESSANWLLCPITNFILKPSSIQFFMS